MKYYAELAKAAGATQFMAALDRPEKRAYWCEEGNFTPDVNRWSGDSSIYQVLDT